MILPDADVCYRAMQGRDSRFDGRFYIAVKTTRVYCRPSCPARTPRPENCRYYRSAAAADDLDITAASVRRVLAATLPLLIDGGVERLDEIVAGMRAVPGAKKRPRSRA